MTWEEITVTVSEAAGEAVTGLFYEVGADGVVIEDTATWDRFIREGNWDAYERPESLLEADRVMIRGYLPVDGALPDRIRQLRCRLDGLTEFFEGADATVSLREIRDEDWSSTWKQFYHTEKIGRRTVISPVWETYEPAEDEVVIRLDPGMAFGTGNHPTTAGALRYLERYLEPGDPVIDVGTGSGILAVAAGLLGAGRILALDNDPVAVRVARENLELNGVRTADVCVSDLLSGITEKARVITANIVADVIIRLLPQARQNMLPGGVFIMSGILDTRWPEVLEACHRHDLKILSVVQEKDWVSAAGRF